MGERDAIAIIGVGCRLPGGVRSLADAVTLFGSGRDVVGEGPRWRWSPPAVTASGRPVPREGAFLDDVDRFDAARFGISVREATAMDPQQRLLLESAWEALEHARLPPDRVSGSRTAVFVGLGLTDWERRTFGSSDLGRLDAWSGTGVFDSVAAGRVAFSLGLRGAALAVNTACSSSLVALHLASRALRAGECDRALVSGVNLLLAPEPTVYFAELGALSPTGRCRTFDADADGYVRGEAVVTLVLERLPEAVAAGRRLLGVVRGSAVNQDGRTQTLTAPNPVAQAELLREALADAGLGPDAPGAIEAHGTGTPLGDPVEVEALRVVFGARERPLYVGSSKTMCGHTEAAAGLVGVVRALAGLRLGRVLPHLHLRTPNPRLAIDGTALVVGRGEGAPLEGPVGVSAFGLSGTNAHVLLEAAPVRRATARARPVPVWVSGDTPEAAREALAQAREAVATGEPLGGVARALAGRATGRHRAGRVAGPEDLGQDWPTVRVRSSPGVVLVCAPAEPSSALVEAFPAIGGTAGRATGAAVAALLGSLGVAPEAFVDLGGAPETGQRFADVAAAEAEGFGLFWSLVELCGSPDPMALLSAWLTSSFLTGGRPDPSALLTDQPDTELPPSPSADTRFWSPEAGRSAHRPTWSLARRPMPLVHALPGEVEGEGALAAGLRGSAVSGGERVLVLPEDPEAALRRLQEPIDAARVVATGSVGALALGAWPTLRNAGLRASLLVVPTATSAGPVLAALGTAGEVRLSADGLGVVERATDPAPALAPLRLPGRLPVLVTGGTGHLGVALVDALASAGARRLLLWSRSGRAPAEADRWRDAGLVVEVRSCDVADEAALRSELRRAGPLEAVVHAAGSAWRDGEVAEALAVRVGALETLLAEVGAEVPVLSVGTVSSFVGGPGLALYAAVNRAAAERLADRGATVVLGPIGGGGLVSRAELAGFAAAGLPAMPVREAAEAVVAALGARGVFGVGALDAHRLARLAPGSRAFLAELAPPARADIEAAVTRELTAVLGRPAPDRDAGWFELGLDSAGVVELAARLSAVLGHRVAPEDLFERPSVAAFVDGPAPRVASPAGAPADDPVVVVGFSCRLPGAPDPEAFWELLAGGREALGPVPPDRWSPSDWPEAPTRGGFLEDVSAFDHEAFGLGASEAAALDPQQRLVLEVGREALDRAGVAEHELRGRAVGVFVGAGRSEYWDRLRDPSAEGYAFAGTGNQSSFLAGRFAHHHGLRGPAMVVDTACSSSLVALHLACRALRDGEASLAVVAGVQVLASPESATWLARVRATSPTGRSLPFSPDADGYVRGEGCVVLVLETLSSARRAGRRPWAVVAGTAVAHDGPSGGLTVPNPAAQEGVLREALARAGRSASEVGFHESHGTGTVLGDAVERSALRRVHADRPTPLVVGALKARIGHLESAAGLASTLGAILALHHGRVPPGPACARGDDLLRFPVEAEPWAGERVASVSAFGLSGTDACAVLVGGDPGAAPLAVARRWNHRRAWVEVPGAGVPCWEVAWVPTRVGPVAGAARVVGVSGPEEVLALVRDARPGKILALRTAGALDGEDPALAAVDALVATALVERPDLDLRLLDRVLDERVAEALGTGEPRIAQRDGELVAPRLVPAGPAPGLAVARGDRWLITGGTGPVGRALAAHLRARGAEVTVVARRPPAEPVPGCRTEVLDVTDAAAVAELVGRVQPAGVVHAAGVFGGAWLRDETAAGLRRFAGPKVDGARALDAALPLEVPLIGIGSAVAWLGRSGQAAYGAANAGLEAVVRARRGRGGAGWVLRFGPWAEGRAACEPWEAEGVTPVASGVAAAALDRAADGMPLRVDWVRFARRSLRVPPWVPVGPAVAPPGFAAWPEGERRSRLLRVVDESVSAVSGRRVGERQGWFDAGLDSLAAVEVARRLQRELGVPVPATALFDRPDPGALVDHLLGVAPRPPVQVASLRAPIAIVGFALRFPGADDPEAFWSLLRERRVAAGPVPRERWDAEAWYAPRPTAPGRAYVRQGAFLDRIDLFDPEAFGLSPREAETLDPQHRLLLEVADEALRDAGLARGARGSRTGVFVGVADRGWAHRVRRPDGPLYPDAWAGTGAEPSFAAGRVAHVLGLTGPTLALNTTCSSTLVALHLAVRALRDGECDAALAGGVALQLLPEDTAYLCQLGALSPTHRCHVFDARADGYLRGEGCGVFVLRRLADAERDGDGILAVVHGSAVGHDGAASGLTVPNGVAQEAVLRAALADAGASPHQVGWLEAHGTGTPLGDPVEVRAADAVYGGRPEPMLLGAVKANLGHLELAAGAASLAKVLLAFRHGRVPPQPEPVVPNPELPLSAFRIVEQETALPPGLVGVSAFGLSGTNAHVLLGPPPARPDTSSPGRLEGWPLAGGSEAEVRSSAAAAWSAAGSPSGIAAGLRGRAAGAWRGWLVADVDRSDVTPTLTPFRVERPATVGFLFSGQGTHHAGMGLALDATEPVARAALDRCAAALDPMLGRPLRELLADRDALASTAVAQPALFAVAWAKAAWLRSLGLEPAVVAGHSLGELVAAAVAGCWDLEDALALVVERGRVLERLARPGAMVALAAGEDDITPLLVPGCVLAAVNAPDEVVVAGEVDAVRATVARLPAGTRAVPLDVGRPFHSPCVDPALDALEAAFALRPARAPGVSLVSLLTGRIERESLAAPSFWRRHAREPVRVVDAAPALAAAAVDVWLDLGARPTLLGALRRCLPGSPAAFLGTGRAEVDGRRAALDAVGGAWVRGVTVDLDALAGPRVARVRLPPRALDRRRFWPEELPASSPTYEVVHEAAPAGLEAAPDGLVTLEPTGPLADRLAALAVARAPRVLVVCRGAEPERAALAAAARCLRLERRDQDTRVLEVLDDLPTPAGVWPSEPEVRLGPEGPQVPRLRRVTLPPSVATWSGTWLVTGGTGWVGRNLAAALAGRGVTRLVLVARREPDEAVTAALRALGVEVEVALGDVAAPGVAEALVARYAPDGVVHAAGVTRPQTVDDLDPATVAETLAAKVLGAVALDRALGDRPLQGFVLVSSIAATWGSKDLFAYAAANGFLDGLARSRRRRGLAGTSVAYGPWAGGGMVDEARASALARVGLSPLAARPASLAALDALASGAPHTVVVAVDPAVLRTALSVVGPPPLLSAWAPTSAPDARTPLAARRPPRARVVDAVVEVLRWRADRPLPEGVPLLELGLDSATATELKARLLQDGLDVALGRLLGGPTVAELVAMAEGAAAPAPPPVGSGPAEGDAADGVLWWTHASAVVVGVGLASAFWAWFG